MYMKLDQDNTAVMETPSQDYHQISLINGLMGFRELTNMEIWYAEEELPFMRMREQTIIDKQEALEFFIIEPSGLIADYQVEINEKDMEELFIQSPKDACLLNILTIHNTEHKKVTVNLVAPILLNKKTLKAKQVIIENLKDYSPRHLLYEDAQ